MLNKIKENLLLVTLFLLLAINQAHATIVPAEPVSVPEPCTGSLLFLTILGIIGYRRIFDKNN